MRTTTLPDGEQVTYAAHKHAATAYNGVTYAYDACGNLVIRTGDGLSSAYLRYDPLGRLVRVSASTEVGSTVCRYTYDGDGNRTKRLDATGTAWATTSATWATATRRSTS